MTRCTYDPRPLLGQPIGMFHCPGGPGQGCLCMVIAGLEHGPCEDGCPEQDDADRAAWAQASASLEREAEPDPPPPES